MTQFIGYTIGLEANRGYAVGKMVKIEYTRDSESVRLKAVSGRNLSAVQGSAVISREQFENRPGSDVEEARWALALCGWSLMSESRIELA